jgi:hypothetical protein
MRSQIADRERISVFNLFTTLHYRSRVWSTPQQHFMMSLEKEKDTAYSKSANRNPRSFSISKFAHFQAVKSSLPIVSGPKINHER